MGTEAIPSNEETTNSISDVEQKIIRQVEYYFGNFNLRKDKFMKEQTLLDDGWMPLETLVKFNRLKVLSEDFNTICDALKKSPNELMEINEDSTKVRRRPEKPVPEESLTNSAIDDRTLYVKGFKKTNTLDELLEFFKEHKAEHVYMRRIPHKQNRAFKGSCFVMFETQEDADKFLGITGIKFGGTELLREKKKDYVKRKDVYYDNLRAEKAQKVANKNTEGATETPTEVTEVPDIEITPGCLLKITGLGQGSTRENIKEALEKHGNMAFVDYFRGNPEAVVRFDSGIAASVLEKVELDDDKKMSIGTFKASLSVIEGDAEKEYWKNIAINKANAKQKWGQQNQRQNKGRFKKNWGQNKRQKRGNRNDESSERPAKRMKVESNDEVKVEQESKEKCAPVEENGNKPAPAPEASS